MSRRALIVRWAAGVAALALLASCSPQDGDHAAGERLSSSPSATEELPGAPEPASSAAIAAARLGPCPDTGSAAEVSDGLPDVQLPCLGDGPPVRLSALRGPLLVNVWASWCVPCKTELPVLAEAARASAGKVAFLGVNVKDFDPDGALGLLASSGVRYPSVVDYSSVTRAPLRWAVGLPMTVLVRADGSIAYRHAGELRSAQEVTALLREHLDVDVS